MTWHGRGIAWHAHGRDRVGAEHGREGHGQVGVCMAG